MVDLVREGGDVNEEERAVLEKSGVLVSRKPKGKGKARSAGGPKHIIFVEEGEEGWFPFMAGPHCKAYHFVRCLPGASRPRFIESGL